jgi:hypothetical protein
VNLIFLQRAEVGLVTNFGSFAHEVTLTAICLAMRFGV